MSQSTTPDQLQRARKALAAMSHADVRQLIDPSRLVRSGIFADIVEAVVAHAAAHGDFTYLNQLLALLQGTTHQKKLVEWVSTRLPVTVQSRDGVTFLRKGTAKAGTQQPLELIFPSAVAARQREQQEAVLQVKRNVSPPRVVFVKGKEDLDMLDSPARLPGSYGSGKRR